MSIRQNKDFSGDIQIGKRDLVLDREWPLLFNDLIDSVVSVYQGYKDSLEDGQLDHLRKFVSISEKCMIEPSITYQYQCDSVP